MCVADPSNLKLWRADAAAAATLPLTGRLDESTLKRLIGAALLAVAVAIAVTAAAG